MDGLNDIPAAAWNAGGALSMLAGLFWMLATGRIVTRREHEGRISDKDQVIATQAKTIEVKDNQLEKISIVGETALKILASVEAYAARQQ